MFGILSSTVKRFPDCSFTQRIPSTREAGIRVFIGLDAKGLNVRE
jgi:hypothetical protein